jgi:acetyl-CoA/propionyl-CoA carboxylase biotin carboxyl carrier protein
VRTGEALVVVSAMKMEHVLLAPRSGTVDILVREGDSVVVDQVVARLTPSGVDDTSDGSTGGAADADDAGRR